MSEADEVGSIVAYLTLNRAEWIRGVRATQEEARKLGADSPNIKIDTNAGSIIVQLQGVRAVADQVGHESPNVRVSSNADKQTAQMHLLLDSILLLSSAAFPIAGVLVGGAIGAVPVLATVALAIKGIAAAQKSGALQNSQYGADVKSVQLWLTQLKTVAASGILNGVDQAIQSSRPLFGLITNDIRGTSNQIGQIIAHDAPALLTIFTQLNPLFVTFGNVISRGAVELEHWAQSGKGATGFVAYVQANLPSVLNFLGNLITLVSHVAQAAAGFGGGVLTGLNLLIEGINALPLSVLQVLIQLIVAARAAMLANAAVTAVVTAVSGAYDKLGASVAGAGAAQNEQSAAAAANARFNQQAAAAASEQAAAAQWASRVNAQASLVVQAAALEEAATVARAKASEAEAYLAIARTAEWSSGRIVLAALAQSAAAQEAASVATVAAAEMSAAATAAAEEIDAAGATASAGWAAALGPVAALAIGVAILSTAFFGNHDAAKSAAEAANSYSQSVSTSTDALNLANIAQTNKNLSDKGALKTLADLTSANVGLKLSSTDLALAVNGTADQYDNVIGKLREFIALHPGFGTGESNSAQVAEQVAGAQRLISVLSTQRKGLQDQILTQTQLNQLNETSVGITDRQAVAGAQLFGLVGTSGVAAYLAAQQAALKNTQQTQAQTIAWQLANDAASLLQQEIDKLSGTKLSYAQAENAFEQQLTQSRTATGALTKATSTHTLAVQAEALAQQRYDAALANPKTSSAALASAKLALARAQAAVTNSTNALTSAQNKNSQSITGMSAQAVQNRSALLSQVSSAEQAADAYGKLMKNTESGRQQLIKLRKEIIDNAVANGENRKAVTDYIDSVLKIPAATTAANKTKFEADTDAAKAKVAALKKQYDDLYAEANMRGPLGVHVDTADDQRKLAELQAQIDALTGKTVKVSFTGAAAADHKAAGGRIYGPGSGTSDSVPIMASAGEEMMNAAATSKYGSIFDQLNRGVPLSSLSIPGPQLPARSMAVRENNTTQKIGGASHKSVTLHQTINNPDREPTSESLPDAMKRAEYAIEGWI